MTAKRVLLVFQLLATLMILALVPGNLTKVALLIPMWWMSFGGLSRKEIISFLIINVIFVVNDIGAIQNGFFAFTHPDVLGLPAWEFIMWGFYLIHTYRFFPPRIPRYLDPKLVALAILFSLSFSIFQDRGHILTATSFILITTIYFFHDFDDIFYCAYLMIVGIGFEAVGIYFDLWSYPKENFQSAMVQFVIMWGAIGIYFRHILCWWIVKAKRESRKYVHFADVRNPEFLENLKRAIAFKSQGHFDESLVLFQQIEKTAFEKSLVLNYEFYKHYSEVSMHFGSIRHAVEMAREALHYVPNAVENARMHLYLCRAYRMMIMMKNARLELTKAFQSLNLEIPTNSIFQTVGAIVQCLWYELRLQLNPKYFDHIPLDNREITVELYEEAGLSAYYFRHFLSLAQCSLLSRAKAFSLGPSMALLNWIGGSASVWILLGFRGFSQRLLVKAQQVAKDLGTKEAEGKCTIWQAVYLDYAHSPLQSANSFHLVLSHFRPYIGGFDYRLTATTISCNFLIRGHFHESYEAIETMANYESPAIRYYSRGRAYYDWYRIGSLGFLGRHEEAQLLIENSNVVFFRVDEERWQISQYLGELLTYYYASPEKSMPQIQECIDRFESLHLSPSLTYLEAVQYWIAKAHLALDFYRQGRWSLQQAKKSLRQLKSCMPHPSVLCHQEVLSLKLKLYSEKEQANFSEKSFEKCQQLISQTQHHWADFELLKIRNEIAKTENEKNLARNRLLAFIEKHGWKGVLHHV